MLADSTESYNSIKSRLSRLREVHSRGLFSVFLIGIHFGVLLYLLSNNDNFLKIAPANAEIAQWKGIEVLHILLLRPLQKEEPVLEKETQA